MNDNLKNYLTERNKDNTILLKKRKQQQQIIAILRGVVFLSGIFAAYHSFSLGQSIFFGVLILFMGLFFYLVKKSIQLNQKNNYLERLIKNIDNELNALNENFSVFDAGKDFIDYTHSFSYDLDIFGEGSIFQVLNRSCTQVGREKLAETLKKPELNPDNIRKKQKAINELAQKTDWYFDFMTTGNTNLGSSPELSWFKNNKNKTEQNRQSLFTWLERPASFPDNLFFRILLIAFPTIACLLLLLSIFDVVSFQLFMLFGLLNLGIIAFYVKKINREHQLIGKRTETLNNYADLLLKIEAEPFKSELLIDLKNQLKQNEKTAGKKLKELKNIIKSLDNRLNLLFAILSNALLLWDLQCVVRLNKWKKTNKELIRHWFTVLAQFDALCSLSSYVRNNPDKCFPTINKNPEKIFRFVNTGHPILAQKTRICNDFTIDNKNKIAIITGANMAGKSTFLRTIGVNLILGMVGCKVCAKEMEFSPIQLFTSVRMNDSLQKHESYFFAELQRLKRLITKLENNENLFVIIDEMLRGTNSKDKHLGSKSLIIRLTELTAWGLVATHDVQLGILKNEFPDAIQTKCFEVEIENNELIFDYKLKNGVSKNLNATFLMRKTGIIKE